MQPMRSPTLYLLLGRFVLLCIMFCASERTTSLQNRREAATMLNSTAASHWKAPYQPSPQTSAPSMSPLIYMCAVMEHSRTEITTCPHVRDLGAVMRLAHAAHGPSVDKWSTGYISATSFIFLGDLNSAAE
ncbi:hypothetical protein IWX46DRAFT_586063 [Phyllosticta citricarpa]|uniref:Secreted protein n=1 Tax=Phyllosticta citricarpa TaxID=55181 RepID=A0ABR1MQJ7_9PEZI